MKLLKKLPNIIKGHATARVLAFADFVTWRLREQKKVSQERRAICALCPLSEPNGTHCNKSLSVIKKVDGKDTTIFGCGCKIVEKSLVMNEECPRGIWP